ncbi:hypothetical protein [Xanthomonas bundabergensis]|uniref:hypothetical protein n=1 Tax=Xanthomonas bundabergensis TaxID=3160842 RepID=UPI0035152DBC
MSKQRVRVRAVLPQREEALLGPSATLRQVVGDRSVKCGKGMGRATSSLPVSADILLDFLLTFGQFAIPATRT